MEDQVKEELRKRIQDSQRILVGIGEEWNLKTAGTQKVMDAYGALDRILKGKDYFIVTTVTDGIIYESSLTSEKIVAPCGNVNWRQCSKSCTKDIWEAGEIPGDICPHCKEPMTGNTIEAERYIEEGYLPQWKEYTKWLSQTLNQKLLILELGVGFQTPTVIRWPFEKTVYFNQSAYLYRINQKFAQISEEIKGKTTAIGKNSVDFWRDFN